MKNKQTIGEAMDEWIEDNPFVTGILVMSLAGNLAWFLISITI